MKHTRLLLMALLVSAAGWTAAWADTFSFSFGTAGSSAFNGSGTLTGSLVAPGEYQITAVTGTTDTGNGTNRAISGITARGLFEDNDNLLFLNPSTSFFDGEGLSYSLENGAMINLYVADGEILERAGGGLVTEAVPISITAVTPEPGTLLLMGTGMLGTFGLMRRRLVA